MERSAHTESFQPLFTLKTRTGTEFPPGRLAVPISPESQTGPGWKGPQWGTCSSRVTPEPRAQECGQRGLEHPREETPAPLWALLQLGHCPGQKLCLLCREIAGLSPCPSQTCWQLLSQRPRGRFDPPTLGAARSLTLREAESPFLLQQNSSAVMIQHFPEQRCELGALRMDLVLHH